MPYIDKDSRERLDESIKHVLNDINTIPGELNYVITRIIVGWVKNKRSTSYESIALVTGVLENVKQEFYRRLAVPYEKLKIIENGDIAEFEKQRVECLKKGRKND